MLVFAHYHVAVFGVSCRWRQNILCKLFWFLTTGSLLSCSPELQALLMNQLTVKVRLWGGAKAPLSVRTFIAIQMRFYIVYSIFITGAEEARPVHWVLLLQHPEASDQPPAEVFSAFHFSSMLPATWDLSVKTSPSLLLAAAALRLCCITSARWKACPYGSRSLSPLVWIQQL